MKLNNRTVEKTTASSVKKYTSNIFNQVWQFQSINHYLGDTAFSDLAILLFWKNATKYPGLQKMAMDYLAVPSSSVQSERENSIAKYSLTDQRNRLLGKYVQTSMCLKSWRRVLPDESVVLDWFFFYFDSQKDLFNFCFRD